MQVQDLHELKVEAEKFVHVRRHKFKRKARVSLEAMKHKHWTKVGTGHYGEAWLHEHWPDVVLKISGRSGWGECQGFDPRADTPPRLDAWPVFAKHCKANPHKNLPEILHLEETTVGITWALMPKYEASTCSSRVVSEVCDAFYYTASGDTAEPWIKALIELKYKHGLTFDLHSQNYMRDATGNVVIIDPFSTVVMPSDWGNDEAWEFGY